MRTVEIPELPEVNDLVKNIDIKKDVDFKSIEIAHRKWVSEIIDLSDFSHCYFVNGLEDAIHHWKLTETRPCQKLEGEYDYPDTIGEPATVCCDVPGQYMNQELGRSAIPADIKNDRPLYLSIPSQADGNFFNPGNLDAPIILDCSYVGSTDIQKINVLKNTEQVFFDFTRGFGKVTQGIGLVYTKQPHVSLERSKNWNEIGIKILDAILSNFTVDYMWKKHKQEQEQICKQHGLNPADCFYLATTRDPQYKGYRRMRWNDTARICITSFFAKYKQQS